MRQCPNCKKTYADDLFFCLDHGLSLVPIYPDVDPNAPTDVNLDIRFDGKTEQMNMLVSEPESIPTRQVAIPIVNETRRDAVAVSPVAVRRSFPILIYLVIGVLLIACLVLAAALLYSNRDSFFAATPPANSVNTPQPRPTPSPVVTQPAVNTAPTSTPLLKAEPKSPVAAGTWSGQWRTDSGTLFDFQLTLRNVDENGLDGRVNWTMRRTARPDKTDKIGLSAVEFVRGGADPLTRVVTLKGYRKDDPDNVLVMLDEYRLLISADGKRLTGLARNGGKWNGKIDLSRGLGE